MRILYLTMYLMVYLTINKCVSTKLNEKRGRGITACARSLLWSKVGAQVNTDLGAAWLITAYTTRSNNRGAES